MENSNRYMQLPEELLGKEIKIILNRINCGSGKWWAYKVVFERFKKGGQSVRRFNKKRTEDKHGNVVYRETYPGIIGLKQIPETTAKNIINRMLQYGFLIRDDDKDTAHLDLALIKKYLDPQYKHLLDGL